MLYPGQYNHSFWSVFLLVYQFVMGLHELIAHIFSGLLHLLVEHRMGRIQVMSVSGLTSNLTCSTQYARIFGVSSK